MEPIGAPGVGKCPQQENNEDPATIQPQHNGRCNYAAELENLDELMYTIVKRVTELGELDNTIIVVAGDHGEQLGDHFQGGKGMPWHASVATPLFVSGPGMGRGMVHEGPVTTMDLGGTWLDYAGVGRDRLAHGMTTLSLRSILSGDGAAPRRPYVSSGYDKWRLVVKDMVPTSPSDPTPTSYKLICCHGQEAIDKRTGAKYFKGCKGAPDTSTPYPSNEPFQLLLYDTIRDADDLVPLEHERPDLVEELLPLLPEGWCGSDGGGGVPPVYSQPLVEGAVFGRNKRRN